jgi:hypothetical protein
MAVTVAIAISVAIGVAVLNGRRRTVGYVAVDGAVAVVHGTDEYAFAAPFVTAPAATATIPVAITVSGIIVVPEKTGLAGGRGLRLEFWFLRLRLRLRRLGLRLGLLGLAIGLGATASLVPFATATAAMATWSGILSLGLVRGLGLRHILRRGLRLVLLNCHACTSCAIGSVVLVRLRWCLSRIGRGFWGCRGRFKTPLSDPLDSV